MTPKIRGRTKCYAKNSIDNDSNPQQYLGVNVAAVHLAATLELVSKGKSFTEENFMPAKKKAAKKKKH